MGLLSARYNAKVHWRPALTGGALITLVSALISCGGSAESKPPGVLIGILPTRSPGASQSPVVAVEGGTPEPTTPPRSPTVVSLAMLDNSPAVPELPSSFAAQSLDAGLQAAIESALAGREGSYSVVVHNLADGRAASLNADKSYYAASLYKLEVLLEAFRQRDAGQLDFGSLLTLEKKYIDLDLKTLDVLEILENDQVTVQDAVRAMTIISDTPTAALLQDTVDPARIDQTLASLGLGSTESANHELPTSARDMARLLTAIAAGEGGVGAESRNAMLCRSWYSRYSRRIRRTPTPGAPLCGCGRGSGSGRTCWPRNRRRSYRRYRQAVWRQSRRRASRRRCRPSTNGAVVLISSFCARPHSRKRRPGSAS